MNWQKSLKNKIKTKEALKNHTTFRIGGPARYFYEPEDYADLAEVLKLAKKLRIRVFILGAGSNILVLDRLINALAIKLSNPFFKKISFNANFVEVGAGCALSQLIRACVKHGLSGAEFLAGIPGALGGALIMNAGIPNKNIGDLVENVVVMDYNGKIKTLPKTKIKFAYRKSDLSKHVILKANLKLIKKNRNEIIKALNAYMQHRKLTQDLRRPSAGCIFKNPKNESAGRIIDSCGLKGRKIGGAMVSKIHANFIINHAKAKATDVLKLVSLVKKQVKKKSGIDLEPEIKIWG